jgi:hypothetical protein
MRLLVLILVAVFSLVLGLFGRSWLNIAALLDQWGYWVVVVLVVTWSYLAAVVLRHQARGIWDWLGWKGLAWVVVAGLFLTSREPAEFKVVMDEPMLMAISQGMHVHRSTTIPARSYTVAGVKEYWGGFQDKRPLLFPFILSLVHDAAGYRVENVFWLNKVLVFVVLILAWQLGRRLDLQFGGELMMLWLCGWPILAQNACGGGFEIFNLMLVLLFCAAVWQFLARSDYDTEAFLLCSCLLLAHTRYESVVYLFVFAGIWLARSIRNRRWSLSWFAVIAPLFLVPILWQRSVFSSSAGESAWEFRGGNDHAFGLDYIRSNLEHACHFLVTPNAELAGSGFFGVLGLLALIALGICLFRAIPQKDPMAPKFKAVLWVVGGVLLGFAVLLSYHWGQLDDPVASRLVLPLVAVMGLAICVIRPLLLPTVHMGRLILTAFALWIAGYALPVMNQHRYSQNNIHTAIFRWAHEEIAHTGARSPLVISFHERLWSVYGVQAMSLADAAVRLPQIEFHRSVRTFDEVFLIQHLIDDFSTRQKVPLSGSRFANGVELETVAERSFYPFNLVRISRVKAIDLDRVEKDKVTPEPFEVFRSVSPADMKAWRDLLP